MKGVLGRLYSALCFTPLFLLAMAIAVLNGPLQLFISFFKNLAEIIKYILKGE